MKTPEEIKAGIRKCFGCGVDYYRDFVCGECPYRSEGQLCTGVLCHDVFALIEQLEKRTSLNTLRDAIYEDAVAHGLWEKTDNAVQRFIKDYQRLEMYNLRCVPDQDEVLRKKKRP